MRTESAMRGSTSSRRAAIRLAMTSRPARRAPPAPGPSGGGTRRRRRPSSRSIAFAGTGFGASSPVSKAQLSSSRALTRRAPSVSPLRQQIEHLRHVDAAPVGGDADHPDGADGEQWQREVVVTAVHLEPTGRLGDDAGRLGRVAGGVLQGDDVRDLAGQAQQGVGGDLAARADRDVVHHHGQVGGGRHRPQVGARCPPATAGCSTGTTREDAGHAELRRLLGEVDRVGRVVGGGAGDDRDRDGLGDGGPQRRASRRP